MGDKRRGQLAPAARSATLPTTGETTETESLFFPGHVSLPFPNVPSVFGGKGDGSV